MPTKIRIELNHDGIRELLMSEPIANECRKAAQEIADRAGVDFEVVEVKGPNEYDGSKYAENKGRAGYMVVATTYDAKVAEAIDKVLSKAVRGVEQGVPPRVPLGSLVETHSEAE